MTNNKIKKTAQKMCNEFKNSKDDAVLYDTLVEDFQNVLAIAKTASRNWKELFVKLTEYLRDIEEYFETQFKGQEDRLIFEYHNGDREGTIIVTFKFHDKALVRTVVCNHQF